MLDDLDSRGPNSTKAEIEQIQAWLLLAIHEFMFIDYRRGWVSAGRAFRLIQLDWYCEKGAGDGDCESEQDWVEAEQHRRTFWMAYCLDRFISLLGRSPLTFDEQVSILNSTP